MDYLERETRARIFLIAIQPRHTAFMQPMSGEVHASVASIAGMLNDILGKRQVSDRLDSRARIIHEDSRRQEI